MKYRLQGLSLVTLLVALTLLWSAPVRAIGGNNNKVLLRDVQTLTLHRGKMTAGRRTSPVPQLSCVGGNACGDYEPDVVQCTNAGFDGSDIQWKCQADLPHNLRFGELDVYCEGYNYPDDPYVLKGSCGLEYKLYYTNVRHNQDQPWKQDYFQQWAAKAKRKSWVETIYLWTWIGIAAFILYSFVKKCIQPSDRGGRHDPPPPYRASGGGGGGGGDGGGGGPGGGWGSGWGNNNNYRNKPTDGTSSAGFRPGFWSGVGVGGLAAHLASRNRQREYEHRPTYPASSSWGTSSSQPSSSYASSSGGFGAASSSSPSSSSSRPATGYGGTRRR